MSQADHIPADLLQAFVEGDLPDDVAASLASHLDACPGCATRAATLEPLAAAFAALPDPQPPKDLVARVLAAHAAAPATPAWSDALDVASLAPVVIGLSLLSAAVGVFFTVGEPIGLAARALLLVGVGARSLAVLQHALPPMSALAPTLFACGLVGAVALLHTFAPARLRYGLLPLEPR